MIDHESVVDPTATETQHSGRDTRRGPPKTWALHIVSSPDKATIGRTIPAAERVAIGRVGGDADVCIDDPKLSRRHVELERRGELELFDLRDRGSKNGTFVGGERVSDTTIAAGDVVRIGRTIAVFDVLAAEDDLDPEIRGRAAALVEAIEQADRATSLDVPVLLLGETGTGKELFSRRLHRKSGRAGPLVVVNCGAIVADLMESQFFGHRKGAFTGATEAGRGLFAEADGGTLFLDEVGEMPPALQPKLLRALESGSFTPVGSTTPSSADVRIVAATNADLRRAVSEGRFRADLYARLAALVVEVPPLRSRRVDIVPLLRHSMERTDPAADVELSSTQVERLLLHDWPMNVRELQTAARRLVLGDEPDLFIATPPEAVSPSAAEPPRGGPPVEELRTMLVTFHGSVARIAEHYGKERRQIYRWLSKHGIDPDSFR